MLKGTGKVLRYTTGVLCLVSWSQARAELILPMHNYPLGRDVVTHGFQVYPGVSVDVNEQNISLAVKPSGDLFFVPRLATVEATDKEVSIAANCSAVETELKSELLLSESRLTLIELLANSRTLLTSLIQTNNSATGSCIQNTSLASSQAELVDKLKNDMIAVKADVQAAKGEFNTCKELAASPADCDTDKQNLADALSKFNSLNVSITTEDAKLTNYRQAKAGSCAEADASAGQITKLTATINDTSKDIADLQDEVIGYIDSMGKD
ncbi:MAG: hypothetical protein M3Q07_02680, partial [Pseudobdellovibrionaceae bacterium]|nr:hypothetical protein [Pseudobdellovibrionaceae bacterium]